MVVSMQIIQNETGKTINQFNKICKKGIQKIVVSKFGNYFVTVFGDNKVVLWDGTELSPKINFANSKCPLDDTGKNSVNP